MLVKSSVILNILFNSLMFFRLISFTRLYLWRFFRFAIVTDKMITDFVDPILS